MWFKTATAADGQAERCRQALEAAGPMKDAWLAVTCVVLNTATPRWYAETLWCDLVHRIMMVTSKLQPFNPLRNHTLPPWTVVVFERQTDERLQPVEIDLRETVRLHLAEVPSDDERHLLSIWRHAPYDHPSDLFILTSALEAARLRRYARVQLGIEMPNSLPQHQLRTQIREGMLALLGAPTEHQTLTYTSSGQVHTDATLAADITASLRQHLDRWDCLFDVTHVTCVLSDDTTGGRLQFDVPSAQYDSLLQMSTQLPDGALQITSCPAREAEVGVVSAATLSRLPQRCAVASVAANMLTRLTAFNIIHWVTGIQGPVCSQPPLTASTIHSMTIAELRDALTIRNSSSKGTQKQLVDRLLTIST